VTWSASRTVAYGAAFACVAWWFTRRLADRWLLVSN